MVPAHGPRTANPGCLLGRVPGASRRGLPQLVEGHRPGLRVSFQSGGAGELVRFYESPLGKHLSKSSRLILQESMQAARPGAPPLGGKWAKACRGARQAPQSKLAGTCRGAIRSGAFFISPGYFRAPVNHKGLTLWCRNIKRLRHPDHASRRDVGAAGRGQLADSVRKSAASYAPSKA